MYLGTYLFLALGNARNDTMTKRLEDYTLCCTCGSVYVIDVYSKYGNKPLCSKCRANLREAAKERRIARAKQ